MPSAPILSRRHLLFMEHQDTAVTQGLVFKATAAGCKTAPELLRSDRGYFAAVPGHTQRAAHVRVLTRLSPHTAKTIPLGSTTLAVKPILLPHELSSSFLIPSVSFL